MACRGGFIFHEVFVVGLYLVLIISLLALRGMHTHIRADVVIMFWVLALPVLLGSIFDSRLRGPLFGFLAGMYTPYGFFVVSVGLSHGVVLALFSGGFIFLIFTLAAVLSGYLAYRHAVEEYELDISGRRIALRLLIIFFIGTGASSIYLILQT